MTEIAAAQINDCAAQPSFVPLGDARGRVVVPNIVNVEALFQLH